MTAPAVPLSRLLRERTAAAHAAAEGSPALTALLDGRVSRPGAAALLGRLAVVYDALERTGRGWRDDPVVGPFLLPGLERSAALAADLRLLGAGPVPSPAAVAYAERLRTHAAASRAAYLAHHYTRCLGDLSGGLLLGAALRDALGLTSLTPSLPPGPAKRQYRALLDAAPLSADEREELVAETLLAYRASTALVAELDAGD